MSRVLGLNVVNILLNGVSGLMRDFSSTQGFIKGFEHGFLR
ncbi:hypothetical protein [Legionella geestiana]|nr:hypothetical protein [Legionella geestiana]